VGGLIGLLVLWRSLAVTHRVAGLLVAVPRFSNTAFVSVMLLLGTGIGASVLHLPALAALWQTSYGKTILVKAGILLVAMVVAAANLLYTKARLETTARLLRRLVAVEVVLVAGAVFAAAVLSSLPPPPPAFAKEGSALAHVGPGPVAATVKRNGYTLRVLVQPNKAVQSNSFALALTRDGAPVRGASITLDFSMLDMQMPDQTYQLKETAPGIYAQRKPALVMVGHWGLGFTVTPQGGTPFTAFLVDRANG
jgi:copper transport protein